MTDVCMLSPQIVTPMIEAHARQREQGARGVCRGQPAMYPTVHV